MDPSKRVVVRLPLTELWIEATSKVATRGASLGKEKIVQLLREGSVCFVVANVGEMLRWIPRTECFKFWKQEVSPHLAEPGTRVDLEQFPGSYCFFASEWLTEDEHKTVVLEMAH